MRGIPVVLTLLAACTTAPPETVDLTLRSTPAPLVVDTTEGRVAGVLDGDVRAFRALPYAAPPVGSLRWRAPRPSERWSGVRDARSFASFCDIRRRDANPIPAGEDCLYVNVYTPADLPHVPLPVIVFLHGAGDSAMSAGDIRPTPPPRLAARGAVVVMVDWRSQTVLSTLYHPALAAEMEGAGNLGVLDLVAALRWIRDNAGRFGGNPHRVLVYGGGYGIPLLATPLARGLFSALIIEGAGRVLTKSANEAAAEGAAYAAAVGCGDVPDPLGCLRALSLEQLLSAPWPPGLHWNVVQDGRVFTEPLLDALARGVDVPVIVGSGRDEASASDVFSDYSQDPYTEADYVAALHAQYDVLGDVVGPLLELYPVADYASPLRAQIAVDSDALVVCYMREVALAAAGGRAHGPRGVWRYLMTHAFQNDPALERLGPHHKQMAHFALGDFANMFGVAYVPTEAEENLARRIQDTWIHFAATGTPNGGALRAHWPRYRPDDEQMLVIDEATSILEGYHIPQCDFWARHPY